MSALKDYIVKYLGHIVKYLASFKTFKQHTRTNVIKVYF